MLTVPRSFFRSLRSLRRKCVAGRPRGPAPPVLVCRRPGSCLWVTHCGEVVLTGIVPADVANFDPFLLPGEFLDAVDGTGDGPVTFSTTPSRVEVRWIDRGEERTQAFATERPSSAHALPEEPESTAAVPEKFLTALHEAGRTAARAAQRYALNRIQIRGVGGDVIAADGVHAYWHRGFSLPFTETILIPALPLFGAPEWSKAAGLRVGRTERHFVVRAGPWAAYLTIDAAGKFPDVKAVVPKSATAAAFDLDPADTALLRDGLAKLPGGRDEHRPVTLDLAPGRQVVVVGRDSASGLAGEIRLCHSAGRGGAVRVEFDRSFLERALKLGCTAIRVVAPDRPVVATGGDITWLAAPIHPGAAASKSTTAAAAVVTVPHHHQPPKEQDTPMKPLEPDGRTESPDAGDPLAEAERLRALLADAAQSAARWWRP